MSDERTVKIKVQSLTKVFGSNPEKALRLRNEGADRADILSKTGQTLGLSNISFDVHEGELLVIMGLSGSGKSTLIRCLNRLIEPTQGDIIIDGETITQLDEKGLRECRRRHFSMVFQHFALFPHKSVRRNAEFGLEVRGVPREERQQKAAEALRQVGLEGWEEAMPNQLSGGMQQRVGLARALASDASVLLMDEAFSALDPLIRHDMQQELIELQHRTRKTTIFITHDLDEAINIGDRIILLKDGEIVQIGTPEEILTHPADDYVARFVQGVDMTRILTASAAMQPVRATARSGDGPRTALYKMREKGLESIYVTDHERRLKGIVTTQRLLESGEIDSIDELIDTACPHVSPNTPLHELFGLFEQRNYPIAVVDEQQRLQGVVVRGALIEQMARAGETA